MLSETSPSTASSALPIESAEAATPIVKALLLTQSTSRKVTAS
jgi:hypothetical protein